MKKFLILTALIMLSNFLKAGVTCGYYPTYNFYLFKVLEPEKEDNSFMDFWIDYAGANQTVGIYDLSNSVESIENDVQNGSSENSVLAAAIRKKDTEMIAYLKDLSAYLSVNTDFYNQWEYPDEEKIKEYFSAYNTLLEKALNYNGTRLKDRYRLMAMRCMFQLEKYADLEKYWLSEGIKTKDAYCKKAMTGLFAGALYHQKKNDAAVNIFMQIGDIQSVKFCLDKKRNLEGIKERYAKDKNDPALVFLVQDFVNMFQENIDEDFGRPFDFSKIGRAEAEEFITFANGIADKKASKTPLMWKTAAAMVSYYLGDLDGAKKLIKQTSSLEGTQRMKDITRVISFFLAAKGEKYSHDKAEYYLGEFKWLDQMEKDDSFFGNAKSRIIVKHILPENKNTNFYTLLGSVDKYTDVRTLSTEELINYLGYISQSKRLDSFERYLLAKSPISLDELNEKIGTRYLGEMNFDKADEYLSKVPTGYYSQVPLGAYMTQRDYTIKRWSVTQEWVDDWALWDDNENGYAVTENQKLKFCREMKALTGNFKTESGNKRAETALLLATYCTQASRWGNCWYLLEYSWSVYDERSKAQQKYENKALEYLEEASKSSVDSVKYNAYYAKIWLLWHDYQYYYDDYMAHSQTVTKEMNNAMADLKKYWDGIYGKGEWSIKCDCIMDYVRTN